MVLLVIGVDKAGKSSMVEVLRQKLRWPILKMSSLKSNEEMAALMAASTALRAISAFKNVILDRFPHPDDLVYGPVCDGRTVSVKTKSLHNTLEDIMLTQDTRIVYCTATRATLVDRFTRAKGVDKDDYVNTEMLDALEKGYEAFLKETTLPKVILSSSVMDPFEMAQEVINFCGLEGAVK